MKHLLIVDDERHAREGLAVALGGAYAISLAAGGAEAISLLQKADPPLDLVLTDLRMPGRSGLDVVAFCRTLPSSPACILMTAYGDIPTAVQAMRAGAADFLPKPLNLDAVETALRRAVGEREGKRDMAILGHSPAMSRVLELVRRVARSDVTVLLIGETGTGKELVAREIHRQSARAAGPFVAVNGAALPREMVESALFGHERGAFTDAHRRHLGYFERAKGGTLLLDEVGELPLETQVKLLRILEDRSFERLGGTETIPLDLRLLAATNRDLEEEVAHGNFRADLFYRIGVISLALPPLRERREDILSLLEHFLKVHANPPRFSAATVSVLSTYDWPGNVRELRNFCDSLAVLRAGEVILPEQLDGRFLIYKEGDRQKEEITLDQALQRTDGNRSRAAKLLGVGRSTLYRRLHTQDGSANERNKKSCQEKSRR